MLASKPYHAGWNYGVAYLGNVRKIQERLDVQSNIEIIIDEDPRTLSREICKWHEERAKTLPYRSCSCLDSTGLAS